MKASTDTYRSGDGETRLRIYAVKMIPHSFLEENQMLLKRLKIFKQKEDQMMME